MLQCGKYIAVIEFQNQVRNNRIGLGGNQIDYDIWGLAALGHTLYYGITSGQMEYRYPFTECVV